MSRVKRRTLKKRGNMRKTRRQRKLSRKTMLKKRVRGGVGEKIKIIEILSKETVNNHTNNENHEVYFIPNSLVSRNVALNQTRYDGIKINESINFKDGVGTSNFFTDSTGIIYSYKDDTNTNIITRIERVYLQGFGKDKITSGILVIGEPDMT